MTSEELKEAAKFLANKPSIANRYDNAGVMLACAYLADQGDKQRLIAALESLLEMPGVIIRDEDIIENHARRERARVVLDEVKAKEQS